MEVMKGDTRTVDSGSCRNPRAIHRECLPNPGGLGFRDRKHTWKYLLGRS